VGPGLWLFFQIRNQPISLGSVGEMETALFLGLTSGGACLATCGPHGLPFRKAPRVSRLGCLVLASGLGDLSKPEGTRRLFLGQSGIGGMANLLRDLPTRPFSWKLSGINPEIPGFSLGHSSGFLSRRDLGIP
jgi:hypothetical protein